MKNKIFALGLILVGSYSIITLPIFYFALNCAEFGCPIMGWWTFHLTFPWSWFTLAFNYPTILGYWFSGTKGTWLQYAVPGFYLINSAILYTMGCWIEARKK